MKGLGRRLTALAMVIVIATAMTGSVYTLWYEELELRASISTGTLDAKIVCNPAAADNDNTLVSAAAVVPGYPKPPTNIGDIDVNATGSLGDYQFAIVANNAYPGYAIACKVELTNTGTVAWHIETQTIVVKQGGTVLDLINDPICNLTTCEAGAVAPTDATKDPVWVSMKDVRGCQIHTTEKQTSDLYIGFNKSATQETPYSFSVKFQVNQWNESGWRACGDQTGPPSLQPPR